MTRREFAFGVGVSALAAQTPPRHVAITIDDFHWQQIPGHDAAHLANRSLLDVRAM
jgi:hypothetical protein